MWSVPKFWLSSGCCGLHLAYPANDEPCTALSLRRIPSASILIACLLSLSPLHCFTDRRLASLPHVRTGYLCGGALDPPVAAHPLSLTEDKSHRKFPSHSERFQTLPVRMRWFLFLKFPISEAILSSLATISQLRKAQILPH